MGRFLLSRWRTILRVLLTPLLCLRRLVLVPAVPAVVPAMVPAMVPAVVFLVLASALARSILRRGRRSSIRGYASGRVRVVSDTARGSPTTRSRRHVSCGSYQCIMHASVSVSIGTPAWWTASHRALVQPCCHSRSGGCNNAAANLQSIISTSRFNQSGHANQRSRHKTAAAENQHSWNEPC